MTGQARERTIWRRAALCCGAMLALLAPAPVARAQEDDVLLVEGFEDEIPDLHTYQASYAGDDTRAHSGACSLRVTPDGASGGAYFRLDGVIDPESDCVFSAWVNAGADGAAQLYISASNGERRYTKASAVGGRAGQWVRLTGVVRAEEWRETDCDVMLAMVVITESWFDDVTLVRADLPEPPIKAYPHVQSLLRRQADARVVAIEPGTRLSLDATDGAFAADLARPEVTSPDVPGLRVPADGLLTFAVDVAEPMYVTGSLALRPDGDLRPGLRAYVLSDCTLVAAPMVVAPAWGPLAPRDAVPDIEGAPPAERVELAEWLLPAGRHYLTVAGPHFRPAGEFRELLVTPIDRPVQAPLLSFALLADTHLSEGHGAYMNVIMGDAAAAALPGELETLWREGAEFALMAGDLVNSATRAQFELLARVLGTTDLPVYGCVGNHDAYHSSSRPDLLELAPDLFPGGRTDYVLDRGPLRFIVMDASYWRTRDGQIVDYYDAENGTGIGLRPEQLEWLRDTLAADMRTPTVVVWHYGFYDRAGESSCGHRMRASTCQGADQVLGILREAPNVIATLSGHSHWNAVNVFEGTAHIQNPAFAEWPNAYRVFRVYDDRMEWEVRQVGNRGFVRESFIPEKAQSWMISTGPGDLTGEVAFTR